MWFAIIFLISLCLLPFVNASARPKRIDRRLDRFVFALRRKD